MININEVIETNRMIEHDNLDVRTITIGISLLDCACSTVELTCERITEKIMRIAGNLAKTAEEISKEFGVPIVNKRISITPISLVGASCCKTPSDYVRIAKTLDAVAEKVGVNFLGGYSAVVSKGMTQSDKLLISSIPEALACTERICSSVNIGSTKTGINMDAVRLMGETIKETARMTAERDSLGCAKLVVLCNAPDDNPFMAGAFHGVTEADAIINVGVSGPGVVHSALKKIGKNASFGEVSETIKKTAFKITRMGQLVASEAAQRLNAQLAPLGMTFSHFEKLCRFFHFGKSEKKNPVMEKLIAAGLRASGRELKPCGSCQSDLSIFLKYGSPRAFSFGIGRDFGAYGGAHQADEYIECDRFLEFTMILGELFTGV